MYRRGFRLSSAATKNLSQRLAIGCLGSRCRGQCQLWIRRAWQHCSSSLLWRDGLQRGSSREAALHLLLEEGLLLLLLSQRLLQLLHAAHELLQRVRILTVKSCWGGASLFRSRRVLRLWCHV